jgi:hypothetical protein
MSAGLQPIPVSWLESVFGTRKTIESVILWPSGSLAIESAIPVSQSNTPLWMDDEVASYGHIFTNANSDLRTEDCVVGALNHARIEDIKTYFLPRCGALGVPRCDCRRACQLAHANVLYRVLCSSIYSKSDCVIRRRSLTSYFPGWLQ